MCKISEKYVSFVLFFIFFKEKKGNAKKVAICIVEGSEYYRIFTV